MNKFKAGDAVWVRAKVWRYYRSPDRLLLEVGNGEVVAIEGDCRQNIECDLKQAIREVLLSDEFMKAFAAAWMKTPLPLAMHFDDKVQERIQSLADYPFGEPSEARAIPGNPVGWELVGFKRIQDDVKVFDEDGDYWTFGGTNDAGDLTSALMPIFRKIEAANEPT